MSCSLIAVGDISFGDSPKCFGFGVKRLVEKKGTDFLFQEIKGFFKSDILFGNLETVLSDEGLVSYDFHSDQMRGAAECVGSLQRAGFNVLNIANNHILEHGEAAFWDCISLLRKEHIAVVGLKGENEYFSEPAILDHAGEKVGFLGYSFEEDNRLGSDLAKIAYAYCTEPERVFADVSKLKHHVDRVVISLHWGLEFAPYPSSYLVGIARKIIDAGADVLLGHHPHVVQCVEEYKGGKICYSLGNFVFDMVWNKLCQQSIFVKFEFQDDGLVQLESTPVKINKNYQPVIDNEMSTELFLKRLDPFPLKSFSKGGESENLAYYKRVVIQQVKDSFLSNLYLLLTTLFRTPWQYLPGKIGYIVKKIIVY